jgi:myosin heavy subunit
VLKCEEYKTEAEVKYISVNRPVETIKYEKTMAYINDVDIHVNDMAAVEDINEVDLLNNLKNRFLQKEIFTNVGPTLIIMNPYQKIEGAFGEKIISDFLKVRKLFSKNF